MKKGFRTPKKLTAKQKSNKIKEAIAMLNDIACVKLAPSPIHGVGLFAIRDIEKGKKLYLDAIPNALDIPYEMFDELLSEVKDIVLGQFPQIVNGSHFLYPATRFLTYVNHSEDANYDAKEDVTLRDIKKGEEITENYKLIEGYEKVFSWLTN